MKTVLYSLYIISLNRFLLNIVIITQKPTNSSKKKYPMYLKGRLSEIQNWRRFSKRKVVFPE